MSLHRKRCRLSNHGQLDWVCQQVLASAQRRATWRWEIETVEKTTENYARGSNDYTTTVAFVFWADVERISTSCDPDKIVSGARLMGWEVGPPDLEFAIYGLKLILRTIWPAISWGHRTRGTSPWIIWGAIVVAKGHAPLHPCPLRLVVTLFSDTRCQ